MQIISCNVRLENCNLVYVTKKKIRDDHNASINRRARKHNTQDRNNINDPRKKHRLRTVSKIILLETGVTVSFFPSQFFPRGKNGPAHSFPGEKTDRSVFSPGERFD